MIDIKTVTVIGANGTMGTNISGIFASFGNATVYMVSRDLEKSKIAAIKAGKSVRAESILKNLIPADYSMLETCIKESDLVFESAAENLDIKREITKRIAGYLQEHAIMCTGTSGLSVTALAECIPESLRSRYLGVHFFNPPYNLALCEVIPTKYTDCRLTEEVKQYLNNVLFRAVVEVKDAPAFLGNRIGFQLINAAMQAAEKYQFRGGIDYIDGILGPFSGRAMAPLVTADFVGLDVHKAIMDNLYANTCDYAHETFRLPVFAQKLVEEGRLGRKVGCGLYRRVLKDDGTKVNFVYDIAADAYREKNHYTFAFAKNMRDSIHNGDYVNAIRALIFDNSEEAEICLRFLLNYIVYGVCTAQTVGYDIHGADTVMATGFNWCPPLAMAEALGTVVDLRTLLRERLEDELLDMDIDQLFDLLQPSKYDYRPYFKASR